MNELLLLQPGDRENAPGVISVAIINDYEIIVRGVAVMLAPFEHRVEIVEIDAGGDPSVPADVALFDTFAGRRQTLARAAEMVNTGLAKHIVLYTWDATPAFVQGAHEAGVSGIFLKSRTAEALVDALEQIVAGSELGFDDVEGDPASRHLELSDRESEVLALIAQGYTNARIADELYLSVETVKTYVKRLYAKLDVHNRAQAAIAASDLQLVSRFR